MDKGHEQIKDVGGVLHLARQDKDDVDEVFIHGTIALLRVWMYRKPVSRTALYPTP